jgi:Holliday junction resolvasome RuvABC ATP-dependent DNA helicase subunit
MHPFDMLGEEPMSREQLVAFWRNAVSSDSMKPSSMLKMEQEELKQTERRGAWRLNEFVGQSHIVRPIKYLIERTVQAGRDSPQLLPEYMFQMICHHMPHLLLCGPHVSGKSTLARIIGHELCCAPEFRNASKLTGEAMLAFLSDGYVLKAIRAIDELPGDALRVLIEALKRPIAPFPSWKIKEAPTVSAKVKTFVLIGMSSDHTRIPRELLNSDLLVFDFLPHSADELVEIFQRFARYLKFNVSSDALKVLLDWENSCPESARYLLEELADRAGLFGRDSTHQITAAEMRKTLTFLGVPSINLSAVNIETRLQDLPPLDFEAFVGRLFEALGYEVDRTPGTGDHGLDLLMRKDGLFEVVQCKRWAGNVGEGVVRDFYGALVHSGARSGFLITTGQFTPAAKAFASGKPIRLMDLNDLIELAREVRVEP